jgi:hypothetical protein
MTRLTVDVRASSSIDFIASVLRDTRDWGLRDFPAARMFSTLCQLILQEILPVDTCRVVLGSIASLLSLRESISNAFV